MSLGAIGPLPPALPRIRSATASLGFDMACDDATGSLLRTLAASKPAGRLLELGTGTGVGAAWLLDGCHGGATLTTVELDPRVAAVAREHLGADVRLRSIVTDGVAFLRDSAARGDRYDLIFADAWPGKYDALDEALALLAPGALYVIDDLLPQPNWPDGHQPRVDALLATLAARPDLTLARLDWSTGIAVGVRTLD